MVQAAMATARAAYRRFADRAADADPARRTRLRGWTVGDLVDHVVWAAGMEAAALRAAAGGEPPGPAPDTLDDAVTAFERASRQPIDPAAVVVLPAGSAPAAYAAQLFAFEAAMHAADLDHALDGEAPALTDDELLACEIVVGPLLDLLATVVPEDDVVIDLVGLGDGIRLSAAGGAWSRGLPDHRPATTTVSGSPHDLVLFVSGRQDATALRVQGAGEHARRFKTYFPGP